MDVEKWHDEHGFVVWTESLGLADVGYKSYISLAEEHKQGWYVLMFDMRLP